MEYRTIQKIVYGVLVVSISLIWGNLWAKIRLFTFHYNRPEFIKLQKRALDKFLLENDDYELIVINDAIDEKLKQEIEDVCRQLDIQCVNFPQELHIIEGVMHYNGSVRHCQVVKYALDNFGYDHDDHIGIFEGDVFLIRQLSIRQLLQDYDIVGAIQTDRQGLGIEYIWIGLCFIDIKNLPNKKTLCFDFTNVGGKASLDSGGSTYYYLQDNPTVRFQKYYRLPIATLPRKDNIALQHMGFTDHEIKFLNSMAYYRPEHPYVSVEFHFDKHFLHYSWSRGNKPGRKLQRFKNFLENILQ